jgi:hypothetical protein
MTGLLFFAIVGIALFIGFVVMSLRGVPQGVPESTLGAFSQIVTLQGSSFANPIRLLDDTEYQIFLSNPDLHNVAKQFRKERRELALLWISLLLGDLRLLWRFRRFLIRQGVAATLGEELETLRVFVLSLLLLSAVKASIWMWGPFVFARATRRARYGVEQMSYVTAGLLGRVPQAGWAEIERNWLRSAG